MWSWWARDLPGSFQIVRPAEVDADPPSAVEWLSGADVGEVLREVRVDQTAWLGANGSSRWSLAGAQAKIALRFDEERAICIERYARRVADGGVVRVHQEDLCQALGVHPDRKYERDGGPSVAAVGALLTRSVDGEVGAHDRARFADALALNWLVAGPDAHAKNYSLLVSGGQVRLAPLYDIASALQYQDFFAPQFRLAMKVGGQYVAARATAVAWRKAAAQLGLDGDAVVGRVADLAEPLPAAFAAAASRRDVGALDSELPQRLTDLVAARCTTLLKVRV